MRALARGVHRAALYAYPASFRHAFGPELDRLFDERLDRASSRTRALSLAIYLVLDALVSGLAERTRARQERWAWPRHATHQANTRSQTMTWESIRADVRLAIRQCRRAPLFAILTVASLALGIGANSAMFGVVEAVLLEPLPYADPGALVTIWSDNTKAGEKNNPVSPGNYEAFKAAPSLAARRRDVLVRHAGADPRRRRTGAGHRLAGHTGHVLVARPCAGPRSQVR